jgi:hypothetical protein
MRQPPQAKQEDGVMQILDVEQGTEEWFRARAGMPTASEFSTVMASGKDGGDSKTRKTYMYKLAGEIITGEPMEGYSNAHMERGKIMEDEARDCYSFVTNAEPERVGFIVNGSKGCSPDSLIGSNGMLEIKTKLPHLMIETLLKDSFPAEHKAQCQGALWVAEREWIDIGVYWPKMPLFIKRAYRDEPYIKSMSDAVDKFNSELAELVERVRQYGQTEAEAA